MKQDLTELVFILDKSGSMIGLEDDTIGGFNAMLLKQQAVEGDCRITTVLFDNNYELLHDRLDIRAVMTLTKEDYRAGGSTALLDAIGKTIKKISDVQLNTAEAYQAKNVMFVIITDGQENFSTQYTAEQVKRMIEERSTCFGWEFIFLGANIDAVQTATHYGISPDRAQDYCFDSLGVELNFQAMSDAISSLRTNQAISKDWNSKIQNDYSKRGKPKKKTR